MKLKDLFGDGVLQEAKEKNLIGTQINGKVIDENTRNEKWAGKFACDNKGLTSLEGSPREVGVFSCSSNQIKSLKGSPNRVNGSFLCNHNLLATLEGAPEFVGSDFHCESNELISLKGAPRYVGGGFSCVDNELLSLEGAPSEIGWYFSCIDNHLTSLHGIHKIIKKMNGDFYARKNPIKSHVLGLMLIDGITRVYLDNEDVETILNDGIENEKHWTEVQVELEEAGFGEYAQL